MKSKGLIMAHLGSKNLKKSFKILINICDTELRYYSEVIKDKSTNLTRKQPRKKKADDVFKAIIFQKAKNMFPLESVVRQTQHLQSLVKTLH